MSVVKCIRNSNGKNKIFYRAQIYVRGVRLADRVFETKAAAHIWEEEEKERLLRGEVKGTKPEMLFSECLNQYLEWAKIRNKSSTMYTYGLRLPYLIQSSLYKMRIEDIDGPAIIRWLEWLKAHSTAKNRGRKSFEKELKILSVVLNWYRNYVDAKFVVPVTRQHREMAEYKTVAYRRPDYFARPEEIRAWVDWLHKYRRPVYSELASFLVLTGCRVGEACGLLWDAVDLDNKLVRITRTVSWDNLTRKPELRDTTKTEESNRIVILPEVLVTILRVVKSRTGENPIVFPGRNGDFLKYNAIQSAFNAGFEALELPWRSTHICRHTYATLALLATRDLSSVQASLGHKNRDVTEKYAKAVALLNSGTAEKTAAVFQLSGNHTQNHTLDGEKMKNP